MRLLNGTKIICKYLKTNKVKSVLMGGVALVLTAMSFSLHSNTYQGKSKANLANSVSDYDIVGNAIPVVGEDNVFRIVDTLDLDAKTWYLPTGSTVIVDGGLIRNGIVYGDNTKLDYTGVVFDKVRVRGSWIVPVINTSMFAQLSYDNSLKDVLALSNPKINNTIYIGPGCYKVSAIKNFDRCLRITSNTVVTLDGNIVLEPNSFPEYSVVLIDGENVVLKGKGSIVGDKFSHLEKKGEWGMGVHISGGVNISVRDIIIKDCWGDCIYIAGKSKNVSIDNCFLDNGRRQGISIVSASDININNCIISNVGGTAPQYAIDIEPNAGENVERVSINNVKSISCQGGIMGYGRAANTTIGTIEIKNSIIEGAQLCPVYFEKGRNVTVEDCSIINSETNFMIVCNDVDSVRIENNLICLSNKAKKHDRMISVNYELHKMVENNIVY